MKKAKNYVIAGIIALILVIGVPIVINELYKVNAGYMTIWGAADVLSYYATILGACVTVGALIVTIIFTKKQVQRDSFIKHQEEKWNRIESMVSSSLDRINPARIIEIILKVTSSSYDEAITAFHLYSLQAKTALDSLFGYLSGEYYPRLEPLLLDIQDAAEEYCGIVSKLDSQYQNLILLEMRKNAQSIYNKAHQNPAAHMRDLLNSQMFLSKTSSLDATEIRAEINALSEQLSALRDTSYRKLLEKKRSTFSAIHDRWPNEADSILRL